MGFDKEFERREPWHHSDVLGGSCRYKRQDKSWSCLKELKTIRARTEGQRQVVDEEVRCVGPGREIRPLNKRLVW